MPADPSFGLKISPGVVLRNVLQQYPSGGQFFLEALQNADDTGRATKFCAMLDLRRHPAASVRTPLEARQGLQGEAILFYDNAGFKDRDWRSLQFMCDSEKRQSPHEAGIFGMGSRSFFHITDVIQVLSHRKLSALDPDDILESGHFGEQVDFLESNLVDNFADECAPFVGLFDCDMRSEFTGSIIRCSLRNEERAKKCTFMPQSFELERAEKIFADFEETLKNGEVALFLTCIQNVELWRWDPDAKEPKRIACTQLGVSSGHKLPEAMSSPSEVKRFLMMFNTFEELEVALKDKDKQPPSVLDIVDMTTEVFGKGAAVSRKWLRCGFFSQDPQIVKLVGACNCVPVVVCALPLGEEALDGICFSSTPLPIVSKLPVHVNAYFRLHDNRRALWRLSPDLDGEHRQWAQWNEQILTAILPHVYAKALQICAVTDDVSADYGLSAWPDEKKLERSFKVVLNPLVNALKSMEVLRTPTGELVKPVSASFFRLPTLALKACKTRLLELCAEKKWVMVDPPEHVVALLHSRKALTEKTCQQVYYEVVVPASPNLDASDLTALLLAFLEWAGQWREPEIKVLSSKLGGVVGIPTEDGTMRKIQACFDPSKSPEAFKVVTQGRVKIDGFITEAGLDATHLWRVLQVCGMKQELTWEDVVEEAESAVADNDIERAEKLFAHIDKRHTVLKGNRALALKKLKELPWIPATAPTTVVSTRPPKASQLMALKDIFPGAARKLVWAVAPSMHVDGCAEPNVKDLRALRTVDAEPTVLLRQVEALASQADESSGTPHLPQSVLIHLRTTFGALVPLLPKLPPLEEHPILKGVAFVPCIGASDGGGAVALFTPARSAFKAKHDHRALHPAFGIVVPADHTIKLLAQSVNVSQEPRSEAMAEILYTEPVEKLGIDLCVALAIELASRVRLKDPLPAKVKVPTSTGNLQPPNQVYIDDAPWRQRDLVTLHPMISADDGRLLGCTSVRQEMARQCEAAEAADGDAFGQEADLVSQVRQLLQEYGDSTDLVKEFVQNSDDACAERVAFILHEENFGSEQLVDPRTAALQGTALYVCSNKPLTKEDIVRMQRVGYSEKRMDFASSGRFGVGLNVMYRYCDCPQLLANDHLHFFDLTRSYVAQTSGSRGKQFKIQQIRENFPDTFAPFEKTGFLERFPTVFRLALRSSRSDLGFGQTPSRVRSELQQSAAIGDKMILFAKHLQRLEFYDGTRLIGRHIVTIQDPEGYKAFHDGLPASPMDLKVGKIHTYMSTKTITTSGTEENAGVAEWAVAFRVGVFNDAMFTVLKAQYNQPHGVALLPAGAAAVKVKPLPEKLKRDGYVCCGLPTNFGTNSMAWVNGAFALLSSRKALPLPEEQEATPSLNKSWNRMLLQGPVADSIHGLICHCTALVLYHGMTMEHYFALFPLCGDRLSQLLARATFRRALNSAVFPVHAGSEIQWVSGPAPLFFCTELTDVLQKALVADGLKLVHLPNDLMLLYEEALERPRTVLDFKALMAWLKEAYAKAQPDLLADVDQDRTGMLCLSKRSFVVDMLEFIVKGMWDEHRRITSGVQMHQFKLDGLIGLPLQMTHNGCITSFAKDRVKFSTGRDLLPDKPELFIDREINRAIEASVDTTAEGIVWEVSTEIPGIRRFTLYDLMPYREQVESCTRGELMFMDARNEILRLFWQLVSETIQATQSMENKKLMIEMVGDWKMLAVNSLAGAGENGEKLIPINMAPKCVAVIFLDQDEAVRASLHGLLEQCGLDIVQEEMCADDRIGTLVKPMAVSTNEELIHLLLKNGSVKSLDGMQRHDLLAYFSVLCIKGGTKLTGISQLELYKTAEQITSFIKLQPGIKYICIDPGDPHAAALGKFKMPGIVMLAWPTAQVKPVYEYCDIKMCNGEEFMVSHVVPLLPDLCKSDTEGVLCKPFFMELHAFACIDGSEKVKRAAGDCPFILSEDGTRMGIASDFTSSAGGCAQSFAETLRPHLPAKWIQASPKYVELLHALGMNPNISSNLLLACARELHKSVEAEGRVTEAMKVQSYELMEEWAYAAEEVWPKNRGPLQAPAQADRANIEVMRNLLEVASLRVIMAYKFDGDQAKQREGASRNSKRAKESAQKTISVEHAQLTLLPLKGLAFRESQKVLWSVCPLAFHHDPTSKVGTPAFKHLLDHHPNGMFNVFASFVNPSSAPLELVMMHFSAVCKMAGTEPGHGAVRVESELHQDFRACWQYLSEQMENIAGPTLHDGLANLKLLPCVSVTSEDMGDKPVDLVMLTLPQYSFFQLPMLRGKEASLRLYLRQVLAETTKEALVFRALGAAERPRASDYATASARVAEKARTLGNVGWEWVVSVLEACARGIHEEVVASAGMGMEVQAKNLHMFTTNGKIEKATNLVWPDEPRWLSRCTGEESLMFVKLQATDEREVANTLVEVAGLRRLSQLLEERRLVDENQDEVTDSPMKQLVEGMVRSSDFAQALRAVMLHNSQQHKRATKLTLAELTRELVGIRFGPVAGELRSALFYKKVPGAQAKEEAITGSEQILNAYYDENQQVVYVGNPSDLSEDAFTAELALALRRAVPDLGQVDSFLMEAMMRSALKDGVDGITGFLEKRDIKVVALKSGQLGPGDTLPPELHDHLNWTMDSTFAEGESVTIMVKDKFIIGEVARWPEGSKQGEGLNRSYLIRVSQELFETRKHFEVYKIQANSAPKVSSTEARRRDSMDLVPVDGQEVRDMTDTSGKLTDDSKHIIEVKAYLKEMSKMPPEDYKLVMRRLFKTWHPDKVGDTPVANKVFLLLRRHENWFKRKQAGENVGDDSWLEKEDADQEDVGKGPILPLPGRQYEKQEGTMGSWFDEFQREMEQSALAKTAKAKTKAEPKDIEAPRANLVGDSSHWQQYERTDGHMFGNRIIDRTQAPKWLQQARLEFVAAKRLICPAGDLRSLPSASVWHSQQVVEMAVKSAMLRTCGVAEDEVTGGAAHDVECFIRRLVATAVNTEEQRRAQLVPGTDADIMWLKASYLGARYPRDSRDGIPGLKYTAGDADRALALAEAFLIWAAHVEDLPDPNKLAVREAAVGEGRWTAVQEELEAASGNVKVMPDKNLADLKPGEPNGAPASLGPGSSEGKRKAEDHVEDQSVKKARRWNKK